MSSLEYCNSLLSQCADNGYHVTVEGNIGCGKSTFLTILMDRFPNIKFIQEPVSQWQNVGGKSLNLLNKYYKQPNRWGFTFQIYAIFTRVKNFVEACNRQPQKLKVSERSLLADKYVFSELMKQLGYMDETEYQIFLQLYKQFEQMLNTQRLKIIYLRCKPQKCHQRTQSRKREEQEEISIQYLKRIHEKHENWLQTSDPSKVLILDTTQDFKNNEKLRKQMIDKVHNFLIQI